MGSHSIFEESPSDILGENGPFKELVPNFKVRTQQQQMAASVLETINNSRILIAEAGTGTGKTFSYLVPAIMSGKRVIISTGTKTLQDQLYNKDIPTVREALNIPFKSALLKGRSNYLCLYRIDQTQREGLLSSKKEVSYLRKIASWAKRTKYGDISEVSSVPEDSLIWPKVTSTGDNCLGKDCLNFEDCFIVKARKEAQESEIIVVNHHLLFADISIKENGFGEILPDADAFIVDEAHQIPEVASDFFGITISSRQINDLLRDIEVEYHKECGDIDGFITHLDKLKKIVLDFRLAFGLDGRRAAWMDVETDNDIISTFSKFQNLFDDFIDILEKASVRGKGIENCYKRAEDLNNTIKLFSGNETIENVKWFETFSKAFILKTTPLDISEDLSELMNKMNASWVFTSATLAVNEKFDHYMKNMGIEDADTLLLNSPFNYSQNAILYSPVNMPEPFERSYTEELIEEVIPLIKACGGRTFLLFTSYKALGIASEIIEEKVDFPLLIQGESARGELLNQFRELGNAILLGTGSFWEGVDVKGAALSLVVIDKLPFSSPGDPVMQARINAINNSGGNAFIDYQLPKAVISLKQGVGRLIRDETDKGVMVIADPRMLTKSYGKTFINSLPKMIKTRRKEGVIRFLEQLV